MYTCRPQNAKKVLFVTVEMEMENMMKALVRSQKMVSELRTCHVSCVIHQEEVELKTELKEVEKMWRSTRWPNLPPIQLWCQPRVRCASCNVFKKSFPYSAY